MTSLLAYYNASAVLVRPDRFYYWVTKIERSERDEFGRPTATAVMGRSPHENAK